MSTQRISYLGGTDAALAHYGIKEAGVFGDIAGRVGERFREAGHRAMKARHEMGEAFGDLADSAKRGARNVALAGMIAGGGAGYQANPQNPALSAALAAPIAPAQAVVGGVRGAMENPASRFTSGLRGMNEGFRAGANTGSSIADKLLSVKKGSEKTAIEWESPKMQAILEGARDKAYERGVLGTDAHGSPAESWAYGDTGSRPVTQQDRRQRSKRIHRLESRPDYQAISEQRQSGALRALDEDREPISFSKRFVDASPEEQRRQAIFGGRASVTSRDLDGTSHIRRTHRSLPHEYDVKDPLAKAIAEFRRATLSHHVLAPRMEETLRKPHVREQLSTIPGALEHLQKHVDAALGRGDVPAFDIKKLRGTG